MRELTPEGETIIGEIAERHGLSVGAVKVMLDAVARGGGTMAQFSHPDFGGSGQWLRGGMTMVGDMFNTSLKTTVDALCSELSAVLGNASQARAIFGAWQSQSQGGMSSSNASTSSSDGMPSHGGGQSSIFAGNRSSGDWWPAELGSPSSVGSQNDTRYAYFPEKRRLAIHRGGRVEVLDTGEHVIHGFGQQQGGGSSISLSSQLGTVALESLKRVGEPVQPAPKSPAAAPSSTAASPGPGAHAHAEPPRHASQPSDAASILGLVEKLAELRDKGVLSEDEFSAKKAELLGRL